jgi:sphingomyelin phosphodiesterase
VEGSLADQLRKYLPHATVFPAMGNHESYPTDQFHLPEYQWLLNNLSQALGNARQPFVGNR